MYTGNTYKVPLTGSWNANPNLDYVANEEMIDVSNINVHKGGREPRGGCVSVNSSPITSTPKITGLTQYTLENGNTFIVVGCTNGTIYTSDESDFTTIDTQLASGLTADTAYHFEIFYDRLYIANGSDMPVSWDGSSTSAVPFLTTAQNTAVTAALAGSGAGNVDDGNHYYKVTFVISGTEYNGNAASSVLTVEDNTTDGQVSLTGIPTGPTGTTARKVYRTTAGGSIYKLLTTISDNTTTVYTDNTADSGLGATIPDSNIGRAPSDWSGSNFPSVFIRHGSRAQKRLWTFLGNYIYASASGTDDMSDANVTTIKIMDTDITGLIEFGGRLLAFSKRKTYIIDDAALDVASWGYQAAAWEGGAAHQRLIVKTPTDVMVMSETAEMFSITASQQYGDYQVGSVTRPKFLHKWVETALDLTRIDQYHGVYDSELRCIKIFMVGQGKTDCDVAMVFFIDSGLWTKHDFLVNLMSSCEVRVSQSDWKIYCGGRSGEVYEMESSTLRDGGSIYETYFYTPPMVFENPRGHKRYDRLWLVNQAVAFETFKVNIYIDDRSLTGGYDVIDELGDNIGDELGNILVSEPDDPWTITMTGAENILRNHGDDVGMVGRRIQAKVYNDLGENYFISQLLFDLTQLGSNYGDQ